MNRKGFTLIELLAVIIVLALVLTLTIPSSINAYKKAKLKTEAVFVSRISGVVDEYISLASQELLKNDDKLSFSELEKESDEIYKKPSTGIQELDEDWTNYKVYKTTITVENLIDNELLFEAKYINPNNKNYSYTDDKGITHNTCKTNAEIEIYKDSDAVYCHKIRFNSFDCLTNDYKKLIMEEEQLGLEGDEFKNYNPYVVDTCVWEKEKVSSEEE